MNATAFPRRPLTGSCNADTCSVEDDGAGAQRTEERASRLRLPSGWHEYARQALGSSKASKGKSIAAE